jgi:hypothetical protein
MDSDTYMHEVNKLNPEAEQFGVLIWFVNCKIGWVIAKLKWPR